MGRIERLPVVLCHRDFWVANIFYKDQKILLLDWDTTGWGYMGEDIASWIYRRHLSRKFPFSIGR